MTTWKNWARNQTANPIRIEHPASEAELVALVQRAATEGRAVKTVGAGHSFTDIACTDDVLVMLDRYKAVLSVDVERYQVTVQAGIALFELNEALDARGLAMPNLGDIAYQSIAGAISTSTHGTGLGLQGLAATVIAMRLVTADGSVLDVDAELLPLARVGLGALGLISTVTLQVVPSFNLSVVNQPMPLDVVLDHIDDHVEGNDHFEFFWVPHTKWALTKSNNRTTEPLAPRPKRTAWWNDTVMENYAFGAVCRLGKLRPALIPKLATALPGSGKVTFVDKSYAVFASKRIVRFTEMEYSIPRAAGPEALRRVRQMIEDRGFMISFPIEVRFTASDDIAMSTSTGRQSCYIAVHMTAGVDNRPYFEAVEAIMNDYGGRPHWGKLHFQTADTLATRYPRFDDFVATRTRLDPDGRFTNPYLDRVLGPLR